MFRKGIFAFFMLIVLPALSSAYNPNDGSFHKQTTLFGVENTIYYLDESATYQDSKRKGDFQPSGSSVDLAWDREKGDPSVVLAILDTGIHWNDWDLTERLYLNKGELPAPAYDLFTGEPVWDANGDGFFNVIDYSDYHVVADEKGQFFPKPGLPFTVYDLNGNRKIDPQDLIKTFSDKELCKNFKIEVAAGFDDDGNGFIDDICGWDFFEDDNDPNDYSSYSAAEGHGTGQAKDAAAQQDNYTGGSGVCPNCMIMPLKTWDSFVQDTNYAGIGALYAARNGANVLSGAMGGLNNSGICKAAFKEAYDRGLVLFMVSSDINSANHNFPTYLNEPIYCAGMVSDVDPLDDYLKPTTYFRNSNLTQFGSKNQISFEAQTGSMSTALSTGAGGILISHAVRMKKGEIKDDLGNIINLPEIPGLTVGYENGMPLHPDNIKQLITLTAEDALPENLGSIGNPDPAQDGWDQHFGYGRVNLNNAVMALEKGLIPPVVRITSPSWNHYLDPTKDRLVLRGDVLPGVNGISGWRIEAAPGIEPLDNAFKTVAAGTAAGKDIVLADLDLNVIKGVFPRGTDFSYLPNTPDEKSPIEAGIQANRHMFTIRIRANDQLDASYFYPYLYPEDRRTMFIHEDKTLHEGWPKYIGVGGEASPRFEDLDGDNLKEVIIATSDGRILIFRHDGTPYTYNGSPVEFSADTFFIAVRHNLKIGDVPLRQSFVTPSIADIDNDGIKEIVAVAGEKLYCFKATGAEQFRPRDFSANFYQDIIDRELSDKNPISAGAMAPPVLVDLDGDGTKEIIVGSGDQRLYAWHANGDPVKGWPVYARKYNVGGKIIYSPCVADLNNDKKPEIVVATNEAVENGKKAKFDLKNVPSAFLPLILNVVSKFISKNCMIYAVRNSGGLNTEGGQRIDPTAFMPGWPAEIESLMPDILPQLGPSAKPCAFDMDGDGADEVVASFTAAKTTILDGKGNVVKVMDQGPMGKNAVGLRDKSLAINFFDSSALGDINGDGKPEIVKGGVTFLCAGNLGLAGQNLPYNQIIQAWDPETGKFLDAFPRTIDDYVLYSEPATADVSGDAIPDIVSGSGLYLIHAFGADGQDKPGFPKLSGGWVMTTPAVDDIDGDGKNELGTVTREGWIFVWDTEGKYTDKPSWPTYGHDNLTTSNLKTDAVAPAAVTEYKWEGDEFSFRCPGDDGFNGKAKTVSIYGYSEPINIGNISYASLLRQITPVNDGNTVYIQMPRDYECYAVVAVDEAGNRSQLPLAGGIPAGGQPISAEAAPDDGGGGGGGMCFINTAAGN